MGPLFEFHRWGSFSTASRRHFRSLRKFSVSCVSFSWNVRGTSTTKSTVTGCVKREIAHMNEAFKVRIFTSVFDGDA